MNGLGRVMLNNPLRVTAQRNWVIPRWERIGGGLDGCTVLELGCGRGMGMELLVRELKAASVEGIDIDPRMLAQARSRLAAPCRVRHGDMTAVESLDGGFDAVVDFGALHLVPEWRQVVNEVVRVLKPGGRFFYEEIACRPSRVALPLSTGRRIPGGFLMKPFHTALDAAGLKSLGFVRPWHLVPTAMIGDVVGVAQKT